MSTRTGVQSGVMPSLDLTTRAAALVRVMTTRADNSGTRVRPGIPHPVFPATRERDGVRRPALDDPIITLNPTFACQCARALKVLLTATLVGLLTGLLGVGGGFLVVPALTLALAMPIGHAAGTSYRPAPARRGWSLHRRAHRG